MLYKKFLDYLEKNKILKQKQDHSKATDASGLKNDHLNIDLKQTVKK